MRIRGNFREIVGERAVRAGFERIARPRAQRNLRNIDNIGPVPRI